MVNSNSDALGIIFPNSYDALVPDLVAERLMASIPFASRYRLVDFILSSMANCGIDNISVVVRKNYLSLMDHLGSGRAYDLVRKNGGLNIVQPYAERGVSVYNGRVQALANILSHLKRQKEKYVILADTNMVANFDFKDFINKHIESGADVTIAYKEEPIPAGLLSAPITDDVLYYTFAIENGRVRNIYMNSKEQGIQNFGMNIYILSRELLIQQIEVAFARGYIYFERDILAPQVNKLNIQGYRYDGYVARITDMKSYFEENMKMLDDVNVDALFSANPIYTKIRDDNPTRYINGANAKNIMAADGCVIEGDVEDSILFRGVRIAKGARVRNCVLMQDTVVEAGADLDYVITDKNVTISAGKELKGNRDFQVFIPKRQTV